MIKYNPNVHKTAFQDKKLFVRKSKRTSNTIGMSWELVILPQEAREAQKVPKYFAYEN